MAAKDAIKKLLTIAEQELPRLNGYEKADIAIKLAMAIENTAVTVASTADVVPTKADLENKPEMQAMTPQSENIAKKMIEAATKTETAQTPAQPAAAKTASVTPIDDTWRNKKLTVDELDDTWTERMMANKELRQYHDKLVAFLKRGFEQKRFTPEWVNQKVEEATDNRVHFGGGKKFNEVIVPKNVKLICAFLIKAYTDEHQAA